MRIINLHSEFALLDPTNEPRLTTERFNEMIRQAGSLRPATKDDIERFAVLFPNERDVVATAEKWYGKEFSEKVSKDKTDLRGMPGMTITVYWTWCTDDTKVNARFWYGPVRWRILVVKV